MQVDARPPALCPLEVEAISIANSQANYRVNVDSWGKPASRRFIQAWPTQKLRQSVIWQPLPSDREHSSHPGRYCAGSIQVHRAPESLFRLRRLPLHLPEPTQVVMY